MSEICLRGLMGPNSQGPLLRQRRALAHVPQGGVGGDTGDLVVSSMDFRPIPLDDETTTLLSEDAVHSLLHLISNTGAAIECRLLSVLVGLTGVSVLH
jgi:hypothetical protein